MITWSVRRPAVIWATCATLVVSGAVAFTRLALATKTTVEFPRLNVSASWFGAAPELMEMYVTAPLEAAVQGVRDVRTVNSMSRDGQSSLTVELEKDANVQLTRLSILERLQVLQKDLPFGVVPRVANYVPDALAEAPLMQILMAGPYTAGTLQKMLTETVSPRLSAVPGVAAVSPPYGGTDIGIGVSYDGQRLRQLGIPPDLIAGAIQSARIVRSVGQEQMGASIRAVVVRDQPHAVEDLAAIPLRAPNGRLFHLGDFATIRAEEDAGGQFFRIDGNPALATTVSREPGADAIRTAAAVRAAVVELQKQLPAGATIKINADQSTELKKELDDLKLRGAIAFGAVLLVLSLLLLDWRAVALVMGSTAVAIAGTALSLFILKIPANLLTLAGLGMGVGILVQNSLIVAERLRGAPATPEGRASAARAILAAITGGTLTTAVVLFPFMYLQGNARAAFMPFAAAFTLALFWSIVTAVTVVPSLAGRHAFRYHPWRWGQRVYARLVGWTLRVRWLTLTLTVLSLAGLSWVFVKKVPRFAWGGSAFGQQRTTLSVSLSFPRGSDATTLDQSMREFEHIVGTRPEIEQVTTSSYGTSAARMLVSFTEEGAFTAVPLQLQEELTQRAVFIGGASVSVQGQGPGFSAGFGGGMNSTFRIKILGYSYSGVEELANNLKARLELITRVRDVNTNSASMAYGGQRNFRVTLEPDRAALARFGITAAQFGAAAAREMRGSSGRALLEIDGEETPVYVRDAGARERSLDELKESLVPNALHAPVRIADLATVNERDALSAIERQDQQYVRILSYDFRGPPKLAQRTHEAFMKSIVVPAGYTVAESTYSFDGEDTSQKGLWLVFGVGVALVILSVALVFDSSWGAAMVFLSIPLALGGVVFGFWVMKAAFTREAAVGVILVIGHAANQSILLVDAALAARRRRIARGERGGIDAGAVVRAAVDRAGMIVIVTLAAMASLLPLALNTKTTSLFGAIALATAGGTIAGTLGTMFIVPAMLFGRRGSRRKGGWFRWMRVFAFWRWFRRKPVHAA
ncbi:MAG TPA: efflux RND transporter permease subunit [Gemmatimonadaceae bacterium]|nr:efflux RND transporter permease subunit [Gemmatimonadaceae bacterium]